MLLSLEGNLAVCGKSCDFRKYCCKIIATRLLLFAGKMSRVKYVHLYFAYLYSLSDRNICPDNHDNKIGRFIV